VPGFGLIVEELGVLMITKSGQVHWRAVQVTGEPVKPLGVVGIDRGVVVNREPKVIPTMHPEREVSKSS